LEVGHEDLMGPTLDQAEIAVPRAWDRAAEEVGSAEVVVASVEEAAAADAGDAYE
jgi:hypothetical protein